MYKIQKCEKEILENAFYTYNSCISGVAAQKEILTKVNQDGQLIACDLKTGESNDPLNADELKPAFIPQLKACWPPGLPIY